MEPPCPICNKIITEGEPSSTLTQRGCDSIKRASEARGVDIIVVAAGQRVHQACRRVFCNENYIKLSKRKRPDDSPVQRQINLRSKEEAFLYSEHCIFCGTGDIYQGKKPDFKLIKVRTDATGFQARILDVCMQRKDDWADQVKARIEFVNDLHAADAVYHKGCDGNFRTSKDIPQRHVYDPETKKVKLGRPKDVLQAEAFEKVMQFLEANDEEQTTITDLIQKMAEYLKGTDAQPYCFTYMKDQIQKQFGNQIIITEVNGKPNVVTWWSTAANILQEFHSQQKQESPEGEKLRIIKTAAKLIKNDMKSVIQQKDFYPQYEELASVEKACEFLPESLRIFLQLLFTSVDSKVKMASIGQAIFQSTRPRVILAPLQVGLGIQLHHHFASRFLIDTLHKLGFSCSYSEVTKFERSASVNDGTEVPNVTTDNFIQYVADNVDHNTCTLDGFDTFHGMGMIATVTPGTSSTKGIPRKTVKVEDITNVGKVNIEHHMSKFDGLQSTYYKGLKAFEQEDPTSNCDLLWRILQSLRPSRPNWSGMMQQAHKGDHPGKSSFLFLPMIDMNPSDMTCVYSTLKFVNSHARSNRVTPILTFDQPLWWKALTVQESVDKDNEIKSMVLRLGGFHTLMSFLGCIGHLMADTGMQELLECIYAGNTVGHMLSGKAVSRAVRGHLLVSGALYTILVSQAFRIPVPQVTHTEDGQDNTPLLGSGSDNSDELEVPTVNAPHRQDETLWLGSKSDDSYESEEHTVNASSMPEVLSAAETLYDDLMSGSITVESLNHSKVLLEIEERLTEHMDSITNNRTAKLWLQYLDMVNIMQIFIKAERTGNWQLHLRTMHQMLPYLAATGHNNYTKSVYLYLQNMNRLENEHPEVHKNFLKGFHVGRRSDRYWAGLSQDLLIEQILMRTMKSTGGMTRGRGMNEVQRLVWLLSASSCSQVNLAMQELTSSTFITSEQHKDMSQTRQKKDMADTMKLLTFLTSQNPFEDNTTLRNIATGVTADDVVNAERAKEVGDKILKDMEGKNVEQHSFTKKSQVITLSNSKTIRIKDEVMHIDPQLLFQRLVSVGMQNENLSEVFQYELCSYPPALFEDKFTPRLANKASLADALWKLMPPDMAVPTTDVQFILDGGALLHRIPWNRGLTYDEICQNYTRYVASHYDKPTVIFDGYVDGPSTKDPTQHRRTGSHVAPTVQFSGSMLLTGKKEDFLSNKENKQRFINLLSQHLERHGCQVNHAKADADLLIVQTAIAAAEKTAKPTVLVADDTDILILLCYHTPSTLSNIYLRGEPRHGMKKTPKCWDISVLMKILGSQVCRDMLFVHAVLGCDTTSHIHGVGKGQALKFIQTSEVFQEQAEVFVNPASTKSDIVAAGETAIVSFYKGQPSDKLDLLRLQRFHQKVGSSTSFVKPEVLPPTSAAAKFHSMRVYLQVQQWMGNGQNIKPEDWGWYIKASRYLPVLTDKAAAPVELLEFIRCNCKSGCGTRHCSCRKNGLDCSPACGQCRGSCSNSSNLEDDDEIYDG